MDHGAGEGEPPPLPAAQLGHQPPLQLPVPELQHAQEVRDLGLEEMVTLLKVQGSVARLYLDVVDAEDAPVVGEDLARREEVVERRVLRHVARHGARHAET